MNLKRVAVFRGLFNEWWLLKEPFVSSSVYRRVFLSKSSFKRSIFTLVEQLNTNLQGICIPPHSCLQWRIRPVTSKHFFPPRAIKYHKIREYSHSKWPTVSLFLTTLTANLSTALSSSCCAWSILPIAGFQTSLQMWPVVSSNIRVECKFLHVWIDS